MSAPSKRFLDTEVPDLPPEKALFHILPVPYEKTVSYGNGTAKGPAAIIAASGQLELWDGQSKPGEEGVYTWPAIDCSRKPERVLQDIALSVGRILSFKKLPVVLGGEHTVTWGVIKGYLDAGVRDFGVVQVDAHADLRDAYEGDKYSHASVMRRVVEAGVPLIQLGIRAFCEEEIEARKKHKVLAFDAVEIAAKNISKIRIPGSFPKNVFFTLDVDGIDPSVLPATGTPVPGGLGWYQTLGLFESVAKQRRIIGFDVMEFAPIEGFHAFDFAAALLTYKLMGIVQRTSG